MTEFFVPAGEVIGGNIVRAGGKVVKIRSVTSVAYLRRNHKYYIIRSSELA